MTELWTDKHKPTKASEIAGQSKAVEEAKAFVAGFRPGKALMLAGPPGSGKSTIPEVLASEEGLSLLRLNASDRRTKEEIERFVQTTRTRDMFRKGKLILVDELEGLSGGDRGAVPGIVGLIRQSRHPVFLIASDTYTRKLAPLRQVSRVVKLTKVPVQSIEKRLRDICARENVKTDPEALKTLARFSQGDLRSAITDLQMAAKGRSSLTVKDLESAGYRDRPSAVFEVLPKVFRSGSPQAAAKAMSGSDKPPEELFLWIESNLALEYSGPNLARAAEILARADIFLSQIVKQRNYRFRRYMLDVLSGLALIPPAGGSFVLYKPPDKLIMMGRSRASRALMSSLCKKIGAVTHSSAKGVRRDYLPYLKILMKKEKVIEGIQLTPEELTMLKS